MCCGQNCNCRVDERKNPEGSIDMTAYEAIKNIEKDDGKVEKEDTFHKFLYTLFNFCELSGFEIQGRVVLKDVKTGKIYR